MCGMLFSIILYKISAWIIALLFKASICDSLVLSESLSIIEICGFIKKESDFKYFFNPELFHYEDS